MRRGLRVREAPVTAAAEIVSTALVLGITVVLFGGLIAWVTTLEGPDRKIEVDLDATLTVTGSGGIINVTHAGGPPLYNNLVTFILKVNGTVELLDLSDGMMLTRWEMGGIWSYTSATIASYSLVELFIINDPTNQVLLSTTLQSGLTGGSNTPIVAMAWATPDVVVGDGSSTYQVKAFVTDRDGNLNLTGAGTVNLSAVGGAAVSLSDTDGDGTYATAVQTLPASVAPGSYNLTVTFTDATGRSASCIAQLKVRSLDAVYIHGSTLTARTEATDWTAATLKSGASVTYSVVALTDSDGDGDNDVVAGGSTRLFHYANSGWSETDVDTDTGSAVTVLIAADIDGSGGTDVVAGTSGGSVFWYNASDNWSRTTVTAALGSSASGLAAADLDADGDLDLVAATAGGKLIQFLNDGSWTTTEVEPGIGAVFESLAVGDLGVGGDSLPDIVAGTDGNALYLYTSGGWGRSEIDASVGTAAAVSVLSLADGEGDGDLDIYVGTDESVVLGYLNDGSWTWPKGIIDADASSGVTGLSLGDADGDGNLDLVVSAGTKLWWYANDFYWTRTEIATVTGLTTVTIGEVTYAA